MNSKAQSMGINIVIIAAIALIILVIITLLVSGAFQRLGSGANSCEAQGGVCGLPDGATAGSGPGQYSLIPPGDHSSNCACYRFNYGS